MDIPYALLNFYLDQITVGYFDDHETPPPTPGGYADRLVALRGWARKHDEMEPLRLGLEHLLGNPQIDAAPLNGGRYPFSNDDVRKLIRYVHDNLWPDAGPVPPGGPPGVRLVNTPLSEWRTLRRTGA